MSERSGNTEIWTLDLLTYEVCQITDHEAMDTHPSWSPDNGNIALASNRSGHFDLWVRNLEKNSLVRLTEGEGDDMAPAWSPDSTRIAFNSTRTGNADVWILHLQDQSLTQVTTHPALDFNACWSPDSKRLAFTSNRDGNDDIWLVDVDEVSAQCSIRPHGMRLVGSFPNPAGSSTAIRFHVPRPSYVMLAIHDLSGHVIKKLACGPARPGPHSVIWNCSDEDGLRAPNGCYICVLSLDGAQQSRRLVLAE